MDAGRAEARDGVLNRGVRDAQGEAEHFSTPSVRTVNGLGSRTVLDAVNVTCKTSIFFRCGHSRCDGGKRRGEPTESECILSLGV